MMTMPPITAPYIKVPLTDNGLGSAPGYEVIAMEIFVLLLQIG